MRKRVLATSEAFSLALHAMVIMAQEPGRKFSAPYLARRLSVSVHHLAKVMKLLSGSGLVFSITGPGGGHRIYVPAEKITLMDIYQAIEGELPARPCLFRRRVCGEKECILGDLLRDLHEKVLGYFSSTRLVDLTGFREKGGDCEDKTGCHQHRWRKM